VGGNVGKLGDRSEIGVGKGKDGMLRTDILALLMLMAKHCGNGFGQMFLDEVGGETWPCCKVATIDCLYPCGWNGVAPCSVEEADVVNLIDSVVSAAGLMRMEVEADLSKAFVLHAFIDHASVIAWSWRGEWNFP
jgi:hypothetical protein